MLIGGVVGYEIQDDLEAPSVRRPKERVEVVERAEKRMDGAVIADVIPEVPHRRGKDGGDPNRVDSKTHQVLKSLRNPLEIADAVPIRVQERPRIDLVDPPRRLSHGHSAFCAVGAPRAFLRFSSAPARSSLRKMVWRGWNQVNRVDQMNGLPPVTATVVPDV